MLSLPLVAQKTDSGLRYKNPVLFADYSDPDAIRSGKDFYLIASTFHFVPGIPILHSRDLIHWEITGHVLPRLNLGPAYDMNGGTRYGGGVWAPSIRFHNGMFYIYFPTPDEGIFVTTASKITGPWSAPVAVVSGPGWEDPCPFWDDDGSAYLVHSKLHAGPLILHRMAPDGKSVLDEGKVIVEDPKNLPTLEGPKFYKRDGWYYIFAPIGGVGGGSQVVLRSRNIYGPYERRIVLAQGDTHINGPHQGAYVETADGRGWFLHFQLHGAHGRIVHLEPVHWQDGWPFMGNVQSGSTLGLPVAEWPTPVIEPESAGLKPQTSDEFDSKTLSPMWEWNHNPDDAHWSLRERKGFLRLWPMSAPDLMHARNTLTETMQDDSLDFTIRMEVRHMGDGTRAGISLFDKNVSYLALQQINGSRSLVFSAQGVDTLGHEVHGDNIILRVHLCDEVATYSYSVDGGHEFKPFGIPVKLAFSWWKGARPALFAFNRNNLSPNHEAYVDFDWARYTAQPSDQK